MTVTEIAHLANVSIGTVDRVLHNRGRVSKETKERIQKIIDETGFQPNVLARHLKRGETYKIGILLPELQKESRYWNLIYSGILQAIQELSAFSFKPELFTFTRPQKDSLVHAFTNMSKAKCSACIIAPVMQKETLSLLPLLSSETPYVFIDTALPEAHPLSTVAQDPFKAGFLAGKIMELLGKSNGSYAVLKPYREAWNLNERARGFTTWFNQKKESKVLELLGPETDNEQEWKNFALSLRQNNNIKGIFAVSANSHLLAKPLNDLNLESKIPFIGFDLVEENIQLLKNGALDCLISQRPEEQGRLIVQQIYKNLILKESENPLIQMPIDIFFKENLP